MLPLRLHLWRRGRRGEHPRGPKAREKGPAAILWEEEATKEKEEAIFVSTKRFLYAVGSGVVVEP